MKMQRKQTFYVKGGKVKIRIMEMPWRVKSKTGLRDCRWMEAIIKEERVGCATGKSVCVPKDKFDFRYGAELALKDALNTKITNQIGTLTYAVAPDAKKDIWLEFKRILPK